MSQRKTIEFKEIMSERVKNDDGFTYVYGAIKDGSTVRPASEATKKAIRNDKRSAKQKEIKRERKERESEDIN